MACGILLGHDRDLRRDLGQRGKKDGFRGLISIGDRRSVRLVTRGNAVGMDRHDGVTGGPHRINQRVHHPLHIGM